MEGDPRVPYDPYHDMRVHAGHDAFARLYDREVHFVAETHTKKASYKRFRKSAVQFIENQSRSQNFDALIPYMAVTYVDRFLLNGKIPPVIKPRKENANLFLIGCLTIAWKLRAETFALSSFLSERNLRYSEQNVADMELEICRYLGWRMRTLTPFCFLEFFVPFLNLPPNTPSPLRSVRPLIVKSQFDIAFTQFRPSVLAASAMLTVYSKMFPDRYGLFETHVITYEFILPQKDMVYKCNKLLAPLYVGPSIPGAREGPGWAERRAAEPKAWPGESSSSDVRKQSDPIPVPERGKEAAIEEGWVRRKGKEPATSEAHPDTEESHQLLQADSCERMNFELGWIQAQADADRRGAGGGGRHAAFVTYFVQRVNGCCNIL